MYVPMGYHRPCGEEGGGSKFKNGCLFFQERVQERKKDLDNALQVHQYYADANEAESWMKEKEAVVSSGDYGKDEDSAEVSGGSDVITSCTHVITSRTHVIMSCTHVIA